LVTAVAISCLLHGTLAAVLLYHRADRKVVDAPPPMGQIELMMVEQKGRADAKPTPPPSTAQKDAPAVSTDNKAKADARSTAQKQGIPPTEKDAALAVPAPSRPTPAHADPADATPAASSQAPVFDLNGTDSLTNAEAMGDRILPAKPDSYRNHAPIYPDSAAASGQQGTVVLLIHVTADGLTAGADIAETSGVLALDNAALDAVRQWRFRPAIQDGKAVPFDMPFRFVFSAR
jgi:periplasmic protein TonB